MKSIFKLVNFSMAEMSISRKQMPSYYKRKKNNSLEPWHKHDFFGTHHHTTRLRKNNITGMQMDVSERHEPSL